MSAPRRPTDVDSSRGVDALAEQHAEHAVALLQHAHDSAPLDADQMVEHALAQLAIGQVIATRLSTIRWPVAAEVLAAGASPASVAAAMGLDRDELVAGLSSWIDGQERLHRRWGDVGLAPADADDVRALLVADEVGTRP